MITSKNGLLRKNEFQIILREKPNKTQRKKKAALNTAPTASCPMRAACVGAGPLAAMKKKKSEYK